MHPATGAIPPSNGLLGNLEDRMTKNLDKIKDNVKRHFRPRERIFVPSSSATTSGNSGNSERLPRSISHVEPPMNSLLSPHSVGNRRESAPSPSTAPTIVPTPSLAPLSIDTFGGETAGSGLHWLNEAGQVDEQEEQQSSYMDAQNISLNMVKHKISEIEGKLKGAREDNHNLNDLMVSSFPHRVGSQTSPDIDRLNEDIKRLKLEIDNLRTLSPRSVPPERPPRPNSALYWSCPRCAEHCPMYSYHCKSCAFPRPTIDPCEAITCSCQHCLQAVGGPTSILRL